MVPRYSFVNVEYTTPHGEVRRHAFTGLPATVWQHENDHLDGVVMLDRCLEEAEVQQFVSHACGCWGFTLVAPTSRLLFWLCGVFWIRVMSGRA